MGRVGVVVLDTCVLFPPSLRDLVLTLGALGAYEVRWSDAILEELIRTVVAQYPDIDPARFEATTVAAMRAAFPDAVVEGWERVVDDMDNDSDDRHVAAAAVVAGADAIITRNVRDFAGHALREGGVAIITPGDLVGGLLDDLADRVVEAVMEMARRKANPPMSVGDVLDVLARQPDLTAVVSRLRALIE